MQSKTIQRMERYKSWDSQWGWTLPTLAVVGAWLCHYLLKGLGAASLSSQKALMRTTKVLTL